jgi:hypothetical protein
VWQVLQLDLNKCAASWREVCRISRPLIAAIGMLARRIPELPHGLSNQAGVFGTRFSASMTATPVSAAFNIAERVGFRQLQGNVWNVPTLAPSRPGDEPPAGCVTVCEIVALDAHRAAARARPSAVTTSGAVRW